MSETTKQEKMYTIRLPRSNERSDDQYVSVNDREWLIQRGKQIEVPKCVYDVLMQREAAMEEAYLRAEEAQKAASRQHE